MEDDVYQASGHECLEECDRNGVEAADGRRSGAISYQCPCTYGKQGNTRRDGAGTAADKPPDGKPNGKPV